MKIVSFNINSIRARLHQLEALIDTHQPDVICLQETKVSDPEFPQAAVEALGYHVAFHGQKTHYGVATLSKTPFTATIKGFTTDEEDAQRRALTTQHQIDGRALTVFNGYFPQGENIAHETKFPNKRRFYGDLMSYLNSQCDPKDDLLIVGDMNISPQDLDIGIGEDNRKRWLRSGKCSFQPEEREWLEKLLDWGLSDCFRTLHPDESQLFSWFDYRSKGFDATPRRGLRIDLILASKPLLQRCVASSIDYDIRGMEKPSDHAPVWAEFK